MILAKTLSTMSGEAITVTQKWAAETEKRGTTISTSTWAYSGSGTLASASLSTPTASVKLTPTTPGTLRNTVTLANGEVLIAYRRVDVFSAPSANVEA